MRDDIKMMVDAGWTPVYSSQDILHKRTDAPHDSVAFQKGNIKVWRVRANSSKMGWQVAELIDDMYRNHRGGNQVVRKDDGSYGSLGNRTDRGINGFIPDLETILKLDKANDL